MDRQTVRDWVHCYNADGVADLGDRHGGGVKPRLSAEQEAEVAGWMRAGPDVAADGVVRWRCADIRARIARLFGVSLHERSAGKSGKALAVPRLHRLGFARVSTRPRHPEADMAAQASFGLDSPASWPRPCPKQCGQPTCRLSVARTALRAPERGPDGPAGHADLRLG